MKFEEALTGSRWRILRVLADGEGSISEIAAAIGTSLPNISQQAKLLEAYGLIKRAKEVKQGPGKPRLRYALGKELAHLAVVREGFAAKRTLSLDPFHSTMLNIWFLPRSEDHYFLQKFLLEQDECFESCFAMAVTDTNQEEIHLLILAPEKELDELRKKRSKTKVSNPRTKKEKTVVAWSHSPIEVEVGVRQKEEYFLNLLKSPHTIFDTEQLIPRLQRGEELER